MFKAGHENKTSKRSRMISNPEGGGFIQFSTEVGERNAPSPLVCFLLLLFAMYKLSSCLLMQASFEHRRGRRVGEDETHQRRCEQFLITHKSMPCPVIGGEMLISCLTIYRGCWEGTYSTISTSNAFEKFSE